MSFQNNGSHHNKNKSLKPYEVILGKGFLFSSIFFCIIFSYGAGIASRKIALHLHFQEYPPTPPFTHVVIDHGDELTSLPNPKLIDGKVAPHTLYTAKNFDTAASATTSSVHLQQNQDVSAARLEGKATSCRAGNDQVCKNSDLHSSLENSTLDDGEETDDEELHLPSGQHLLVDIKHVDSAFLNSEARLAHAMVKVVNESKLTLLSYHCHSLVPTGVSCVGVLLESHVSFHTWPEEGVITLDLFTCGSGELVPVLPLIENAFAIPQQSGVKKEDVEQPVVVWSHKMRGFRSFKDRHENIWSNDLGNFIVERTHFDLKVQVATTETKFQRIHIFDSISAKDSDMLSYQKSLSNDGSYQSQNPEFYVPNRNVFLEGVIQSTRYGDEAYHEALVHPAMFTHVNPRRVGIIGGGEGATLREVLKHTSIEKVKMIEIDEVMVKFSREHVPFMSDCSDFIGSAEWCGDDKRADIKYEDAVAWLNDRFSENKINSPEYQEDPFDVLIMDALDPQDDVPFADLLYTNVAFLKSIFDALTENGIVVMQLGQAPDLISPPETIGYNEKRGILTQILSKAGFQSIHVYEESHCGFFAPWSFLIASKSEVSKKRWYRSNGEIDVDIHKRIIRTHSGKSALKYFDGATMMSYQLPSKAFEAAYCKDDPVPDGCKIVNKGNTTVGQSVRRSRQNPFNIYLDRHTYESNDGDMNGMFCDYLYYNENSSIRFPQELKKHCNAINS